MLAGIVLPAIIHGVQVSTAMASDAKYRIEASSLSQSKMAELIAAGDIYEAEMEGDFGEDLPQYAWVAELNDWEEDGTLVQLDVSVIWEHRGATRQVTLVTLVNSEDRGE